jgi:hypothetical protein
MEGFLRPEAIVLDENAIVPEENLIVPPPNQFTHELVRAQPFYFAEAQEGDSPSGHFPVGTKLVLLRHDGGDHCRVVDGRGLHVATRHDGLRKL